MRQGTFAVVPAEERASLNGSDIEKRDSKDGEEIAALLWSYLVVKHLDIDPAVVFHEGGYRGSSQWLIETFESENYIGAPLLQWMGLIQWDQETNALKLLRWLRE